jgi:trimethylamine--corrinoid protein Co-methyltransferase
MSDGGSEAMRRSAGAGADPRTASASGPRDVPGAAPSGAASAGRQQAPARDSGIVRPRLELLSPELVERVLAEALELLREPGVRVQSAEATALLVEAGARREPSTDVLRIPEAPVRAALATAPGAFDLYGRDGSPAVRYGQGRVQFDPGSSGVTVLDADTLEARPSQAADLARLTIVAEALPAYDAVSTAVVCHDVPTEIGDLYRLLVVLLHSGKPVVTGAFTAAGLGPMLELLALEAGGGVAHAARPRAVFDVCPSPPLTWSAFGAANLMELARARIPAEIVSMPLAGVAAPVTLVGAVVQHAAECLAGVTIHQLAGPGAPVVWGGAPAIIDMRSGATPMGAIETAMIDAAYAQVGRSLGLPTHAYLGASDSKLIDAQAGLETGVTALVGALAGIDLISGAGMLDFLLTQSPEKLVLDADAIGMARRLVGGIGTPTPTLATAAFAAAGREGRFLELDETRRLFRGEQFIPSPVIDRGSRRAWLDAGSQDTFARARARVDALVAAARPLALDADTAAALVDLVRRTGEPHGLATLPGLPAGVGATSG